MIVIDKNNFLRIIKNVFDMSKIMNIILGSWIKKQNVLSHSGATVFI